MANFDYKKYLAEGKLNENMFDVDATEKIAQTVADAFTAEDNELDLKYKVHPGTGESSFDLDVERGANTPDQDSRGQDIDNYLGDFAGGSFYIKDGVVYNAAMRNAPVANVSPEGEVEMISAADSRAAIGMEENKEETKSNKMKKSELKEMIRTAFLSEAQPSEFDANKPARIEAFLKELDALVNEYHAELYLNDEFFSAIDDVKSAAKAEMGGPVGDIPGFEGTKDALDSLSIREEEEEDADAEVEVDAEDVDVDVDTEADMEAPAEPEMSGDTKEVQDNLEAALAAAKAMGDQKLVDQIGNSITFFTRTHVVGKEETAMEEAEDTVTVNEVEFPMWTKIKK